MATSYNGWPASPDKDAIGVTTFGDAQGYPFPGGVKAGDVATVLGYVAMALHTRVEPCVNGWCWGYSYRDNVNNPGQLSCHASATAIDWNAPDHPNGSSGTFTDDQVGEIYTILAEVEGAVSWLQGYDEMHFEICVDAGTLAGVASRLGGSTPPPPTPTDWFDDMATEQDLIDAIDARLAWWLPRLANIMTDGQPNAAFAKGSTLMLDGKGITGTVKQTGKDLPTNVWTKTVTSETAATLLARAANG